MKAEHNLKSALAASDSQPASDNKTNYKQRILETFDGAAKEYGKKGNEFFDFFAGKLVDRATLAKGSKVLDVACGRGAILKRLLSHSQAIGIDISPQMVLRTQKDFPEKNVLLMDAEAMSFSDCSFDALFCGFGVMFFPNIEQALCEFYRVVKPSGTLAISTWGAKDPKAVRLAEAFTAHGINPKVQLHSFDKEAFIQEKLQTAGFNDITSERVSCTCSYESFDEWFSTLWTHASRAVLSQCSPQILDAVKSAFREYEGKFQVTLEAILTIARK